MNLTKCLTTLIAVWCSQCILITHQSRVPDDSNLRSTRQTGSSILEIMNIDHINKIIAERQEATRLELEEESNESEAPDIYPSIGFEYNKQSPVDHQTNKESIQYNDTIIPFVKTKQRHSLPHHQSPSESSESPYNRSPDKVLKSSKNALYVTRKEYLKKDWCKTESLVQRIREDGCIPRNIINRFCYGQCNSFFIPKSPGSKANRSKHNTHLSTFAEPEDLTEAVFRSCSFCTPSKFTWITVSLRCPSLVPQLRYKKIQRIKQCRCMTEVQK